MKKLKLILPLLFIAIFTMGAKIDDNTLRVGTKTGSDITLQLGVGAIKWSDGSSKIQVSNDGIGFVSITDISANDALLIENTAIASSVAANALTIDLKIADGSTDPSGGSPAKTAFRDVTVTDGAYDIISATAALSLVVPSGATLGHTDGTDHFIYIYELNNAGAIELAVSSALKDDSSVQTSVTIDTSSDDDGLYSTVGRSNVPIRLIARLKSNQATAGTWVSVMAENTPGAHIFTDIQNNLALKVSGFGDTGLRTLAAKFGCNASPSIAFQRGGTWVTSIDQTATGICSLNLDTSVFDNVPACTAVVDDTASQLCTIDAGIPITDDLISVICRVSTTGAAVNYNAYIVCYGN